MSRPQHAWDGAHRDPYAVVERHKVELHETAREVQGQLASRIAVLERLIAASSGQIKRMEQLLNELHAAEQQRDAADAAPSRSA